MLRMRSESLADQKLLYVYHRGIKYSNLLYLMEWTRLLTAVVSGCVRNRDRRLSAVLVFSRLVQNYE